MLDICITLLLLIDHVNIGNTDVICQKLIYIADFYIVDYTCLSGECIDFVFLEKLIEFMSTHIDIYKIKCRVVYKIFSSFIQTHWIIAQITLSSNVHIIL